jgi:ribosomal protein L11 methyltransferase
VTVPAAEAEIAAAMLLDVFPGGLEEEPGGDLVILSGYLGPGQVPALPAGLTAAAQPVAPGWREGWRAFHRPAVVGPFWIGPPWLEPAAGLRPVVIDPGTAFGTGAHGSTRAAAELLLRLPPGGALLDIGCGSGVLAILAAMLGFAPVLALDADPLAVAATAANAAANGVQVAVSHADALNDPLPAVAAAVANLQLDLLRPLCARPSLPPCLIVSGLLESEAFTAPGRYTRDEAVRDGWRAIRLEREP